MRKLPVSVNLNYKVYLHMYRIVKMVIKCEWRMENELRFYVRTALKMPETRKESKDLLSPAFEPANSHF